VTLKSEVDEAWDDIRTTVTYIANLRAARAKAVALNRILPALQRRFDQHLSETDECLKLGPSDLAEIEQILTEELSSGLLT
jgi:hypothetical protein